MMSFDYRALVGFLQDEGFGEAGEDIFAFFMPADKEGLLLLPSQMPIREDRYAPDKRTGDFRLIARAEDWDTPARLLTEVSAALRGEGLTIGNMRFFYIQPSGEPLIYPKSDGDLVEASVSYNVSYVLT